MPYCVQYISDQARAGALFGEYDFRVRLFFVVSKAMLPCVCVD